MKALLRWPALGVALLSMLNSCSFAERTHEIPKTDKSIVMVLSSRLPGPLRRVARHGYLAARKSPRHAWVIWECCDPSAALSEDPFVPTFGDEVVLHGLVTGADAASAIECIGPATEAYGAPNYRAWPGANSNTYVEAMLRECEIPVSLPPTAVGKDYRGWIGGGVTSEGTGLQLETVLVGLKVGLKEGIEVHILGLSLGLDLWPPAILVPVGTGRWGFGDR